MSKLTGKTAIITGAAAGFGRATAFKFAEEGANLTLVDLNESGLLETEKAIAEKHPACRILKVKADVSDEAAVRGFVDSTVNTFGGLDIMFNNAGIEGATGFTADMPYDLFRRDLEVNLHSVFLGMKYAIGYMKDHGGGTVVNTSSIGGLVALPGSCGYVATKHAIIGLTKNAAAEYGSAGIRVNAICPGFVMTDLHRRVLKGLAKGDEDRIKEMVASNSKTTPLGRYGEPDEIADLVLFLVSADSAYINGIAVAIDGGFTVL
ncbi:MAG TPA: glucose 1-dehydrogenase [Anaerovoracaceae bacterium]|nr:glucose 1-dehydrogenase [Anaerovoracaceae bacterium]